MKKYQNKYQNMEVNGFLYFALVQFQFDAIYSMILDFVSWSVYWQLIFHCLQPALVNYELSLDWMMSEAFQCYRRK